MPDAAAWSLSGEKDGNFESLESEKVQKKK